MNRMLSCAVLAILGTGLPAQAQDMPRIARVIIAGNTEIPDYAILGVARIRPGEPLRPSDLQGAEERLRKTKWFDPATGPTVKTQPNDIDSGFADVVIQVGERPWNGVVWGVYELRAGICGLAPEHLWSGALMLKTGLPRLREWRAAQPR